MEADIELQATVGDGKYTIIFEKQGKLYALRYGEPWRDCLGDGMILAMLQEIVSLKTALEAILAEPYGCTHCDSGKARDEAKGHQPDCPYEIARAAVAKAKGE